LLDNGLDHHPRGKMPILSRRSAFASIAIVAGAMLVGTSSSSYAETGSVRLKVTKVGFIVGVGGGSGVLTFKGKSYRFSVGGVSAGTIGAAGADLAGTATGLRTAADIAGTYSAASGSIAVAGGSKVVTL